MPVMKIRTKIIATVGPASGSVETLRLLAEAGCDVFRINFSHGDLKQHEEFLQRIRHVEVDIGEPLAVMADLCGPKIRVGGIEGGSVLLVRGQRVIIQREPILGQADRISTTFAELPGEVKPGETILMDDGKISLEVVETRAPEECVCRVLRGGILASGKGVNLPRTRLRLSALTEKDRRDVAWIAKRDFDYVALSFVRSGDDIQELRELLSEKGSGAHIIAKLEKPQAVENIDAILDVADGVMVARGDLGVEMDLPAVPVAQKRIARLSHKAGKSCIIATQMLETMTHAPTPTRAEVSDVANAVLDHADAVMLSGETAIGEYPVQAVRMMDRIVAEIQAYHDETAQPTPILYMPARTSAALARAVWEILRAEKIAAVAVFTATGTTARMFAKARLPCPILALSPDIAAVRRMCLYYGVESVQAETPEHTRDVLALAARYAVQRGLARVGEKIVVVSGRPLGKPGATNTLVVHTIS